MSYAKLALASACALALCASTGADASLAQTPVNLAPPPILAPSTTGAQIGSFDPNALNNPAWLIPAGAVAPKPGANFAPASQIAQPSGMSTAGNCDLYDSWCAYCVDHPSADVCADGEAGP